MKTLILSVLAVAMIGLMVPAVYSQSSPNLSVSVNNAYSSNSFSGIQVVEIVIDDSDISDTTTAQTEPTVTIDGNKINMVQATDGKWYAYIASLDHVKWADSTVTSPGLGFDFGEFCSYHTDTSVLGMELHSSGGVAIARPYTGSTSSTNGDSSFQACAGGSVGSGAITNNVVRNPPTPVSDSVSTGQIGIDTNAWPMIQLYYLTEDATYNIEYDKNGSMQNIELVYEYVQEQGIAEPQNIHTDSNIKLTNFMQSLNVDPTSKDIWTIVEKGAYYRLFDSSGNAEGDGNNPYRIGENDIDSQMMSDAILNNFPKATGDVPFVITKSNGFQTVDSNGDSASLSDEFFTMIETENNSSVFTTVDSNGISSIKPNMLNISNCPTCPVHVISHDSYEFVFGWEENNMDIDFVFWHVAPTLQPQTITIQEDEVGFIPIVFEDSSHCFDYIKWAVMTDWPLGNLEATSSTTPIGIVEGHEVYDTQGGFSNRSPCDNLNGQWYFLYDRPYFSGTQELTLLIGTEFSLEHPPLENEFTSTVTMTVIVEPVNDPPLALGLDKEWHDRGDNYCAVYEGDLSQMVQEKLTQ